MHVFVQVYNPQWAEQFLQIKGELEGCLNKDRYISIEHVGSTSVVGLAAKPKIDVDIVIQKEHLTSITEALKAAQYEPLGDCGVPDRYAFRAPKFCTIPQNLYVCIEGCLSLKNHLMVRDLCRKDPHIRHLYGQTKLELSKREWESEDEYCEAKNDILALVLNQAGMNLGESAQIRAVNTAAGRISKWGYIFEQVCGVSGVLLVFQTSVKRVCSCNRRVIYWPSLHLLAIAIYPRILFLHPQYCMENTGAVSAPRTERGSFSHACHSEVEQVGLDFWNIFKPQGGWTIRIFAVFN